MSWLDDAAEAEKRGVSYGQWMALKPQGMKVEGVIDQNARLCVFCKKPIKDRDGFRRKTCSEKCRHDWNNYLARERARIKRGYYNVSYPMGDRPGAG